jgi:hypothetical protein
MMVCRSNCLLFPARIPAGAHEYREAAMAVYQALRYRGLAVFVRSYRIMWSVFEIPGNKKGLPKEASLVRQDG